MVVVADRGKAGRTALEAETGAAAVGSTTDADAAVAVHSPDSEAAWGPTDPLAF